MNKLILITMILVMAGACSARIATAQPVAERDAPSPKTVTNDSFLLGPPKGDPVVVRANFQLHDINEINEQDETFAFSGVLTLRWHDERQVFDPAATGVDEKVYQGAYQFDELSTGWFPQVVLVNEAGKYEKHGVLLRIQPDGTLTLIETLNAVANAQLNMRRFPFDRQRLEAVFAVLGFDDSEVVLQAEFQTTSPVANTVRIPQWSITGIRMWTRNLPIPYAGRGGLASTFVVSVDAQRESFYISRLVIFPLVLIVILSFSVFWMDRSALGDRISVSFIGILTGVAYQIVMSEILPRISYLTLVHGIINLSFMTMCATVVINIVVGTLEQNGKSELGDRIDRRCRWLFPLIYFGLMLVALGAAFFFF